MPLFPREEPMKRWKGRWLLLLLTSLQGLSTLGPEGWEIEFGWKREKLNKKVGLQVGEICWTTCYRCFIGVLCFMFQ